MKWDHTLPGQCRGIAKGGGVPVAQKPSFVEGYIISNSEQYLWSLPEHYYFDQLLRHRTRVYYVGRKETEEREDDREDQEDDRPETETY